MRTRMKGKMLSKLIKSTVDEVNKPLGEGAVPNIISAWDQVIHNSIDQCK